MSGGVPAGEHDPECGLLYEDGQEHCTCKLLPCPFCGSEARYEIYRDAAHVLCGNDDCEADVGPWYTNDGGKGLVKAIERWNTRATPTPPIEGRDADVERATTTLDVFLAAYRHRPDHKLARPIADDDLLTWGDLRTILAALQALGERG